MKLYCMYTLLIISTLCLIISATESHDGRRVVCFGCSTGIGEAIGASFVQQGGSVVFNSRSQVKVEAAAEKALRSGKGKAFGVSGDCEKEADIKFVIEKAIEYMGGIDCIIWAPTGTAFGWFEELGDKLNTGFDSHIVTNVKALLWAVRDSLDELVKSKNPTIITISSIAGASPITRSMLYCISKAAQEMAVKSLAYELSHYGIRTFAIQPATIVTPIWDIHFDEKTKNEFLKENTPSRHLLNRNGESEEVAELALFLASERSSFMTGTIIPVDGGSRVLNSHTSLFDNYIGDRPDRRHQKTKTV